jgi:outer membrane protein TolC
MTPLSRNATSYWHFSYSAALTRSIRTAVVLAVAAFVTACAALSPDGGMEAVVDIAGYELKKDVVAIRTDEDALATRARVGRLLKRPLTADTAVQIALLNHRGLQAAYNALGIAEAVMVEASLPPNPTFSIERIADRVEIEIERKILANILALITLPARAEIAADRFRQAQFRAAEETLRVAAEARRAYYRAVAARELVGFLEQSKSAADAASQLAIRLGETGAINKLDQAREHVFYAELTAQLATARRRAASERERLIRAMGLWGLDLEFRLPNALPALPRRPKSLPAIEIEAIRRRVDLHVARIEVETLAKSYGLTGATRFINLLEAGGISRTVVEREHDEHIRGRGFEVEFRIPIFGLGEPQVRQAEQTYMQAVNRLIERAVNARSQARDAYRSYRSTYDIAGHYQREVLPLRKIISDETLLRFNAMQIDVFALLTEARQRITATIAAIEAKREFWLAKTELLTAIVGGSAPGEAAEGPGPMAGAAGGGGEAPGH